MNFLAVNTADRLEILLQSAEKRLYFCAEDKTLASVELLSRIEQMVKDASIKLEELDFFAAVTGPGSFTGIRIGVTTVNTLSYALGIPAVDISLFDYMVQSQALPVSAVVNGTGGVCYIKNVPPDSNVSNAACIRNEKVFELAYSNIVVSSDFLPPDARIKVFAPSKDGFAAAAIDAFNRSDKSIGKLEPVYLRRAQAERSGDEL